MDPEDLRSLMRGSGADLWAVIEGAIDVAVQEHGEELRARRDGIVERLYARGSERCRICGRRGEEEKGSSSPAKRPGYDSPATPQEEGGEEEAEEEEEEDEEEVEVRRSIDDQKKKILGIKEFLDDQDQSDDSLVSMLQNLADMDVTVEVLKETDIGRHVNRLRKHSSSEVRRLVKFLVRKWMETVDEFVKSTNDNAANIMDSDSPMQLIIGRSIENGDQVAEFGSLPNPENGTAQEKKMVVRGEAPPPPPSKPIHSTTPISATSNKMWQHKNILEDPERLASATRRLQQNYQEAENAKKQRTIQMVEIHDIPKPKNAFVQRNRSGGGRGGGAHPGKRW